jgi:LytS/YehU family sensor histidine kinase
VRIRYARQRHNVTTYHFEIKPFWYQTLLFNILLGLLVAAFLGFIILSFRFRVQRQKLRESQLKKEKTATELKAIRSQLNPHFVFNALGSIQGLINSNEIDAANRYLSGFASLMRNTLTGSNKPGSSIFHEINLLKNYLDLEQLRFHFAYQIQADPGIDLSATEIPSLLIQPLAENAVKHGVSALGEKGNIVIEIKKENADINVLIGDNGPGFPIGESTAGFGLKLTRDRISLLNQLSKDQNISLAIERGTGGGTMVYLKLKNWLL